MCEWLAIATRRSVVVRSLKFAVVVGALLATINHGDAIWRGNIDANQLRKMNLTVLVPFCVSTFSSVGAIRSRSDDSAGR